MGRKSMVKNEFFWHSQNLISFIPGFLGIKLRRVFLRDRFRECGEGLFIREGTWFDHIHKISLGDNVSFNRGVLINGVGGITIGSDTGIGPRCFIHSGEHTFDRPGEDYKHRPLIKKETKIGKRVFVGAHSIILAGSEIGDDVVVGAGSVVKGKIAPRTVVAGVPARVIRKR